MHCVHRASSVEEADIVVAWLADRGIDALVKNRHVQLTLQVPLATSPRGVEVVVLDAMQAERAKSLLAEHAEDRRHRVPTIPAGTVIRATCEECGRASDFPVELRGSVQSCPNCRANMDVEEPPSFC